MCSSTGQDVLAQALILSSVVCEPMEKGDSNGSRFDQRPRAHVAKATEERGW